MVSLRLYRGLHSFFCVLCAVAFIYLISVKTSWWSETAHFTSRAGRSVMANNKTIHQHKGPAKRIQHVAEASSNIGTCKIRHLAFVWPPCCTMLHNVEQSLTENIAFKQSPTFLLFSGVKNHCCIRLATSYNTVQHHPILQSFGQALRAGYQICHSMKQSLKCITHKRSLPSK